MYLKDIPFNPQASEKAIERGKNWLVANRDVTYTTACFAILSETAIKGHPNSPCHGSIKRTSLENRCLVATRNIRDGNYSVPSKEECDPFLDWLLYESYMGRYILNRDDRDFCRDHGFIVSADVYTPLMQNVLITTRHFKECNRASFLKFNELIEKGCDPTLAYIVCFCSWLSYGASSAPETSAVQNYGAHRASNLGNLETLSNILLGRTGPQVEDEKLTDTALTYRYFLDYTGGKALFQGKGDLDYQGNESHFMGQLIRENEDLRERLKEFRKASPAEAYKPPNPFKARAAGDIPVLKPDQVNYKELFEVVIPYMMETKPWLNCTKQAE